MIPWNVQIDHSVTNYPIYKTPIEWQDINYSKNHTLPENALVGCILETGEEAFITKAKIDFQFVTGLTTRNGSINASIPYGCVEHRVSSYQVLVTENSSDLFWKQCSNGSIPILAVAGGVDRGEKLYIGRTCTHLTDGIAYEFGNLTLNRLCTEGTRLGKVHPSHRCLYIPYNGREYRFSTYEVLCHKISPGNLAQICRWEIFKIYQQNNRRSFNRTKSISKKTNGFPSFVSQLPIPPLVKKFLLEK